MSQVVRRFGALSYVRCREQQMPKSLHKTIGPNTVLRVHPDGHYSITLHGSTILEFYADGAVLLYSAGYRTTTTKQRLCALSPVHVCQTKGEWFVGHQKFYEGMNVGKPRNEREALEKGMREGDELAARMLQDMEQGI